MNALVQNRRPAAIFAASLAAILLARFAALSAPRAAEQRPAPSGEIAANLAAGRVIFCVAKDASSLPLSPEPVKPVRARRRLSR